MRASLLLTIPLGLLGLACEREQASEGEVDSDSAIGTLAETVPPAPLALPDGLFLLTLSQRPLADPQLWFTGDREWIELQTHFEPFEAGSLTTGVDGRLHLLAGDALLGVGPDLQLTHTPPPQQGAGLAGMQLAGGPEGVAWVIPRWNPRTLLRHDDDWKRSTIGDQGPSGTELRGLTISSDGKPWVAIDNTLWQGTPEGDAWIKVFGSLDQVIAMQPDPGGAIVLLTDDHLLRVRPDAGGHEDERKQHDVTEPSLLAIGADSRIVIGNPSCRFEEHDAELRNARHIPSNEACEVADRLALDTSGRLWTGDSAKLQAFDATGSLVAWVNIRGRITDIAIVGAGPTLTSSELLGPPIADDFPPPSAVDPSAVDSSAAGPIEPAPVAEPPPTGPGSPAQNFTWQLSTRKSLDEAKQLREQLDAGLLERGLPGHAYLLQQRNKYMIMAGSFATPAEAEREFEQAKQIFGQGGFVRAMAEFCPATRELEPGVHACDLEAVRTLTVSQLVHVPDPAGYGAEPPRVRERPRTLAPITWAPASEVLVIATNKRFVPGEGLGSKIEHRTFIWRPADGPLPQADESAEPGSETGEPPSTIVEQREGLIVSDKTALWSIELREATLDQPRCNCDAWFEDPDRLVPDPSKRVPITLTGLDARPLAGGAVVELIPPNWRDSEFGELTMTSANPCLAGSDELARNMRVYAVAGSKILVADHHHFDACGVEPTENWQTVLVDLDGRSRTNDLSTLEAEFPSPTTDRLRRVAAEPIGWDGVEEEPHHLDLTAILPGFVERKQGLHVMLQYTGLTCVHCDYDGEWGTATSSERVQATLVPSSSLMPPEDVIALMRWVWQHEPSWKVIGWSRTNASG
jgi:hypothetical protein